MLYLLVWVLVGWITMFITAAIHLYEAEKMGYKALEWWTENQSAILGACADSPSHLAIKYMLGLIVWPIRLIQFTLDLKYFFSMYDLKDEEEF